jgi:hypothetical protein
MSVDYAPATVAMKESVVTDRHKATLGPWADVFSSGLNLEVAQSLEQVLPFEKGKRRNVSLQGMVWQTRIVNVGSFKRIHPCMCFHAFQNLLE